MDRLVLQRSLQGAALTKAVASLMPEATIEEILDGVRKIINDRVLSDLKTQDFPSGLHVVQSLSIQGHDVSALVNLLIVDDKFPEILKKELAVIRDSGLMNSFCKFVTVEKDLAPKGCFCFSNPRDRKA